MGNEFLIILNVSWGISCFLKKHLLQGVFPPRDILRWDLNCLDSCFGGSKYFCEFRIIPGVISLVAGDGAAPDRRWRLTVFPGHLLLSITPTARDGLSCNRRLAKSSISQGRIYIWASMGCSTGAPRPEGPPSSKTF